MKPILIILRIVITVAIVFVAFFGCKTRVNNTTKKTNETVIKSSANSSYINNKNVSETKIPGIDVKLNLGNPCDSSGRLKPVYFVFKQGANNTSVDTRNGTLQVNNSCDSSIKRLERELEAKNSFIRNHFSQKTEDKKETAQITNRIPGKYWLWLVISICLNLLLIYLIFK